MSFLDNLENNLKAMESRDEKGDWDSHHRREAERQNARAAAPYAERLKSAPFTAELLDKVTLAGHKLRTKVHMTWLGTTLRLEARERKLELQPTPNGVIAVFFEGPNPVRTVPVDLEGNPEALASEWLPAASAQQG